MSRVPPEGLVQVLVDAGVLPAGTEARAGDALSPTGTAEHSPWYIQALLVAGAWLAAILFTVFFFGWLLAGIKSGPAYAVVGLAVCGGCAWIMRTRPSARFLVQFALALGIAGQLLFGYGIGEQANEVLTATLAVAVLNGAVIPAARQRLQTFLSVIISSGAILVALWDIKWWTGTNLLVVVLGLGTVLAWELRPWYARRDWRPAGYGLVMSFLGVLHLSLYPASEIFRYREEGTSWWISTAGLLVLLAVMIVRVAGGLGYGLGTRPVQLLLAGAAALAAVAYNSPGILGALIVLGLGYRRRERVLTGLAILFLAVFLSAYYYHLELTLLEKSAALAGSGVLLLLSGFLLKRTAPGQEAADA